MLDIINIYKKKINQGSNNVNEHTNIGEQCVDSSLQPEDGSPM